MNFPANWHDDGTTLTSPNGVGITEGFRAFLLGNAEFLAIAGNPLGPPQHVDAVGMDPAHGPGDELLFQCGALAWIPQDQAIVILWIGAMVAALREQLAAALARVAVLEAAPPTPAPLTPAQDADLAAMAAIRAALKSA